MKQLKTAFFALWLATLVAGCSLLQENGVSFSDAIASAYTTIEVVNDNTTTRLEAGTLDIEDAEVIASMTAEARVLTDAALAAYRAGDEGRANTTLTLAINLLTALEARVAQ